MTLLNNIVETFIPDMSDQHLSQILPTNMALLNNTVETFIPDTFCMTDQYGFIKQ